MPARVGDEYCLGRFDVETRPFTICELARGAGFECGNLECDGARVEQVIGVDKFYVVTARSSKTPVESRILAEVVLVDAKSASIPGVRSVDPSSTTIISMCGYVCARAESSEAAT